MSIQVRGASEHNLKDVDATFGPGLTVVTGVSGSGKTSLVFDTLYHEAQRRYLEVFALGSSGLRLAPANVRAIDGLGPAIAVGQNLLNRNPASTLATASGLHPLLRLLYANFGMRRCPRCAASLAVLSDDAMVERLAALAAQAPVTVSASLVRRIPGSHRTLLQLLADAAGPGSLRVDGAPWRATPLDPAAPHDIDVVVAQLDAATLTVDIRRAVEAAWALGSHALVAHAAGMDETLSRAPVCPGCGAWFDELAPQHFHRPCPHCQGQGCDHCGHTGLTPQAVAVHWQGLHLPALLAHSVADLAARFAAADALPSSAARLHTEITRRLDALQRVGLGYLTLNRPAPTWSRGEAQRVRLAVALVSRLEDMVHVLDEPTVGQHPADVQRLLPALRQLPGPVIFVEHDRVTAAAADHAVDLGPGAGDQGGRVLFQGSPSALWRADTPTGRYFSGRSQVATPPLRPAPERFLTVRGASLRNLQHLDVAIPLGRLTVVTGVSGSGKSTLARDVLVASLSSGRPVGCHTIETGGARLQPVLVDQSPIGRNPRSNPATYTKLADILRDRFALDTGLSPAHFSFNRPEGACPTCQGMGAVEVRMRYLPSSWIPCSDCAGRRFREEILNRAVALGEDVLSMADLFELSVDQALELCTPAAGFTGADGAAAERILGALHAIGLGYLTLGQPSTTLSGGEAQRVKLAKFLGRASLTGQLLVLDEPSTGLHPQDIAGLLTVFDRLVRDGATLVAVEHNTDIIRAADWIVDLGPGAGPGGGRLLFAGPQPALNRATESATAQALRDEQTVQPRAAPAPRATAGAPAIVVRNASANNLRGVSVAIPKGKLTVVTGVSGSGKSSLVHDVLEAEARRRFLESLSMYERQSTREGAEAPVESIAGLGVAITVGPERRRFERRATVGTATELSHHLAVLLSLRGARDCPHCGHLLARIPGRREQWQCPQCGFSAPIPQPRHFSPSNYAAACTTCSGVGTLQAPAPGQLIIAPARPLCGGAMHSPGFFPKGFLCKPFNSGYDLLQALAARHGFDPAGTPWDAMSPAAQHAFLFGDPEPLEVTFHSRAGRSYTRQAAFPGFYGWIRDWDVGGAYTCTEQCPTCGGGRLRSDYLAVTLAGRTMHQLVLAPLSELQRLLDTEVAPLADVPGQGLRPLAEASLATVRRRLAFLCQVGLGYLHLDRISATLSAGEAQRVKLAGLLGSGLVSLAVLLDEPSRGLHPAEVDALIAALAVLRDEGNTVVVVEHELAIVRAADHVIDLGPGAGAQGGRVVAAGPPALIAAAQTATGAWLRGAASGLPVSAPRRAPQGWMTLRGARENNLSGQDVALPLGVLVGVCGVSGSGKSTLMVDTLARALAPKRQTTSVAYEPLAPGAYDGIDHAPPRTVVVDQARAGVTNPADFLGISRGLRALYAQSEDAQALGLDADDLGRACSDCHGQGAVKVDMGFLPDVYTPCETCHGTGYRPEAWDVRLDGLALPELFSLTVDEVLDRFSSVDAIRRPLAAAQSVGLGYLVLRQPGYTLSGGEAQRLKIAGELCRKAAPGTLYLLDEPTVGQHMADVARLVAVLHRLVDAGHSVAVIEHHVHVLAACDWLLELGPGGGPAGGRVVAQGTPEQLAAGATPTARYLAAELAAELGFGAFRGAAEENAR